MEGTFLGGCLFFVFLTYLGFVDELIQIMFWGKSQFAGHCINWAHTWFL